MEDIKSQNQGLYTTDPHHAHESSDINVRAILGFGAFLVLSAAVMFPGLYGMHYLLEKWADTRDKAPNPAMTQKMAQEPPMYMSMPAGTTDEIKKREAQRILDTFPEPRLQPFEYKEYADLKRDQDRYMNEYAVIDKNSGTVRIPIDRAIEIMAERGLPAVKPPAQP